MKQIVVYEFLCSSCWTGLQTAEPVEGDSLTCVVCFEPMYRGSILEVR